MANYTQDRQHTQRDHQIWKEYTRLGMTITGIAQRHGLSRTRVYQILQRENKKLKNAAGKGGAVL